MKKEQEFKHALMMLRSNLKYQKQNLRDTKKLIKMCGTLPEKQNYKRRLLRDIPKYDKQIIEFTRAIKILSR